MASLLALPSFTSGLAGAEPAGFNRFQMAFWWCACARAACARIAVSPPPAIASL
jgi:hypothetical protein